MTHVQPPLVCTGASFPGLSLLIGSGPGMGIEYHNKHTWCTLIIIIGYVCGGWSFKQGIFIDQLEIGHTETRNMYRNKKHVVQTCKLRIARTQTQGAWLIPRPHGRHFLSSCAVHRLRGRRESGDPPTQPGNEATLVAAQSQASHVCRM